MARDLFMPRPMKWCRPRRSPRLTLQFAVLVCVACSKGRESQVAVRADSAAAATNPPTGPDNVAKPHPANSLVNPRVIYVEATDAEIAAARSGVSAEDFAVIADDLMFYRSAAIERLEGWHIPLTRVAGRRPMAFVVRGKSVTTDFKNVTTLDFIVVQRPNEKPRVFAPSEVDEVRAYWESGASATDSTDQAAGPGTLLRGARCRDGAHYLPAVPDFRGHGGRFRRDPALCDASAQLVGRKAGYTDAPLAALAGRRHRAAARTAHIGTERSGERLPSALGESWCPGAAALRHARCCAYPRPIRRGSPSSGAGSSNSLTGKCSWRSGGLRRIH